MDRTDLQRLAESRVADADALLLAGRWAAAYYLLGYAVECALKACAARQFHENEVPDKTVVNDFYTHRLDKLLGISGVKKGLEDKAGAEAAFQINWNQFVTGAKLRGTIIQRRRQRLATCSLQSLTQMQGYYRG